MEGIKQPRNFRILKGRQDANGLISVSGQGPIKSNPIYRGGTAIRRDERSAKRLIIVNISMNGAARR